MNILILSCGTRSSILPLLRTAAGPDVRLIAADADPWATALYDADKWHLIPSAGADGYLSRVLELCRAEAVCAVIPLAADARAALAQGRDRFSGEDIALICSEDELKDHFGGAGTSLYPAYQSCFAEAKPSLGRRVYKSIARCLSPAFKNWLCLLPGRLTTFRENKRVIRTEKRRIVYLVDSPAHSNLGDHAIAYAQRRFIQQALPEARIVEISIALVDMHLGFIRRHIRSDDLFCMIGGGNFGDEYVLHEYSKRKVCTMFPDHRVIVFPQTISYSDTPRGRRELALTQEALDPHAYLTITARDRVSHERAQVYFPNAKCILTPDIVLSLAPICSDVRRIGVLCCLRKDLERNATLSAGDVLTRLADDGYTFTLSDTAGGRNVSLQARTKALEAKWREFCGAELVITDRLHGMIFSCITSTPCIVIDNYNHKIRNFYRTWLAEVPTVRFAETADDILPMTRELLAQGAQPWDPAKLAADYAPLLDAILKEV